MDSITQAALGASIGELVLGKKIGKKGALIGAVVATIPDLDVILLPFLDPIERLSMHRGYSHSIVFSILGAILLTYIFRKWKLTKNIEPLKLFLFSWLSLFTHMLLDAFTPYGTSLFLPFSDIRLGFDSINIIDPFYTLPLLLGLGLSIFYKKNNGIKKYANIIGVLVSSGYLILTLFVKADIETKFNNEFNSQEVEVSKILTMPVGLGSFHWYGLGRTENGFYIGNYSYLEDSPIDLTYFPSNESILQKVEPYTADRMKWFSKDFFHMVEEGDSIFFYNMQVDMQGIIDLGTRKAPTKGYFILENKQNGKLIGSGRH